MCPPSITSSSERQVKQVALVLVNDTPVSLAPLGMFAVFSRLMLWAWSSAYSLVPISIASSSVLRIRFHTLSSYARCSTAGVEQAMSLFFLSCSWEVLP